MKRFYTLLEKPWRDYPFALVPFHLIKEMKWHKAKHWIIDSGVEIFAHGAKDYPAWFFSRYEFYAKQYAEIYGDRIWVVIPDYPDDYRNNPIPHNVHKTLVNIKRFHVVKNVNWVYPLQSDYLNPQNFHDCCHQVMKYCPERVAIGTVCKTRNIEFIEKCCMMARRHFPVSHIHAFGATLKALPRILPFIDSWDSTAYFTSSAYSQSGKGLCRNQKEREQYFRDYLVRVNEILKDFNSQMRF